MRRVVVNSTPIIVLGNIGRVGLLRDLYGEIVIPEAVRDEVLAKQDDATRSSRIYTGWMGVGDAVTWP